MIGSGVFLLPASLASYGGISIVGWLFTAAGAFLLAYVFARLARGYPVTGGPYAYGRRAFGDWLKYETKKHHPELVHPEGELFAEMPPQFQSTQFRTPTHV